MGIMPTRLQPERLCRGGCSGGAAEPPAGSRCPEPSAKPVWRCRDDEEMAAEDYMPLEGLTGPEWVGDWTELEKCELPDPDEQGRPAAAAREYHRLVADGKPANARCAPTPRPQAPRWTHWKLGNRPCVCPLVYTVRWSPSQLTQSAEGQS